MSYLLMNAELNSTDLMHGQNDGFLLTKVPHVGSEVSKEAGEMVGDSLIGPFKVPEGVNMNSDNYQKFLRND